jgi:hypothetical protein
MLPTLTDLGVQAGCYIRKIDRRTHWRPEGCDEDLSARSSLAAEKVFRPNEKTYCFWYVETDHEFYGVIASLIANATPKDRDIDFIWMTQDELDYIGVALHHVPEGNCRHVQNLHFEAEILPSTAQALCYHLMAIGRESYRCKKKNTTAIHQHQIQIGCNAVNLEATDCKCEEE